MDPQIPNAEMRALKDENKVLKGKIRGYQTLGQLFQETKEKNRILQAELQTKEMVSVGTETRPLSLPSGTNDIPENESRNLMEIPNKIPKSAQEECPSANAYHESAYHHDEQSDPLELYKSSLACALKSKSQWQPFSSIENVDRPEEVNLHLRKKLEDALQMVGELDRKRSNDKKLVKILNDEVKKTKDELQFIKQQLEKTLREKELVMNKVAILERERDNIPDNTVIPLTTGKEVEGAEDWVHLKPETAMEATDEKDYQLQQLEERCKELHEKAFKWENEHFTLQMEYTKHITDLRLLLESKSKELVAVTESLNSDKKLLEAKFKTLEVMLKKEKDDKMESYNLHQETIRKYKLLEKKFLALEAKNKASISKGADSIQFEMMNVAKQTVSTSDEKVLGLQQQINLFKDDFVKEKKERVFAEKRAKEFEEKLRYLSKQLAKKESDLQHIQLRESPLYNTHVPKTSKMPPCWSCDYCTFLNDPQVEECKICKAPKTSRAERPGWKCNYCTYLNSYKTDMCCVCNVVRTKNADVGSNQPLDDDLTIDGPQTE